MRPSSRRLARRAGRSDDGLRTPSATMPGSGRRCEVFVEYLGGGLPAEGLPWPRVQGGGNGGEVLCARAREVGPSPGVLAQEAVGGLVGGGPARAPRIAEGDPRARGGPDAGLPGPPRGPGPR